ncbi:MAG: hypothetical protein J07HX64_00174 [halophilic archaeon J07HX64]|nr:MAG: hypothetical protein J07HX64_00174 [halophilic archaeon J07HX64]
MFRGDVESREQPAKRRLLGGVAVLGPVEIRRHTASPLEFERDRERPTVTRVQRVLLGNVRAGDGRRVDQPARANGPVGQCRVRPGGEFGFEIQKPLGGPILGPLDSLTGGVDGATLLICSFGHR